MGWVWERPSLTLIEIVWRWVFGIPLLAVCFSEVQKLLVLVPLETAGLTHIDPQTLVLARMDRALRMRPLAMIALQAAWLCLLAAVGELWFRSIQWAAETHITPQGEPDLIGYSMWVIFLSLGFFTLWALASWPLSVAPLLMLLEDCSAVSALGRAFRLGKPFTSKLVEINLVMGIVKLALIVLAMVLSAAPLPFSDELGPQSMHIVWLASSVFYLVASDYFQVVRLKGFIEFWRMFRGEPSRAGN